MHLSLVNIEDWLPRRGLITKASGVRPFSDQPGIFGPRVKRVFLSDPELSTAVGPTSPAQKKNSQNMFGEILNFFCSYLGSIEMASW